MTKVIPFRKKNCFSVDDLIEELRTDRPDLIIAFSIRGGEYRLLVSDAELSSTLVLGALERMKGCL